MKNETKIIGSMSLGGLASFDLRLHRMDGCAEKCCWVTGGLGQISLSIGASAQLLQALRATTDAEYSKLWRLMSAAAHHITAAYLRMSIEPQCSSVGGWVYPSPPKEYSRPASVTARPVDEESLDAMALLLETAALRAAQQGAGDYSSVAPSGSARLLREDRKTTVGQIMIAGIASLNLDLHKSGGCSSKTCRLTGVGTVHLSIGDSAQLRLLSMANTKGAGPWRSLRAVAHEVVARYLQMSTQPAYADVAGDIFASERSGSEPDEVQVHTSNGESFEATARLLESIALSVARESR
jgi:hypothetical protein